MNLDSKASVPKVKVKRLNEDGTKRDQSLFAGVSPLSPRLENVPFFSVALIGAQGCGKTSLVNRIAYGRFDAEYEPTDDISNASTTKFFESVTLELELIDAPPTQPAEVLAKKPHCLVLMYNLDDPKSFSMLKDTLLPEVLDHYEAAARAAAYAAKRGSKRGSKKSSRSSVRDSRKTKMKGSSLENLPPVILLANKCDHPDRSVDYDVGSDFSETLGCEYLEISCKENINVDDAWQRLVTLVESHQRAVHEGVNSPLRSALSPRGEVEVQQSEAFDAGEDKKCIVF